MTKVSVKTGDTVLVNSGKDSGKKGKVLAVYREKDSVRVLVEGVNIVTKAKKARTAQEKSELVKQEAAIDVSNVNVICPACGKAVRVAHAVVNGKKVRVCPKCAASLDKKFVKDTSKKKASETNSEKAEKPAKAEKTATKTEKAKAEKPEQKKSKTTVSAEKATKTAVAKKPTTSRSSQRGV